MGINIRLCEGWRLLTDRYNWILAREEGDRLLYDGFYSTLESAINGFVEKKIRGFDSSSLHSLNFSIKALQNQFYKAIQECGIGEEKK